MNRRAFLKQMSLPLVVGYMPAVARAANKEIKPQNARPNILWILAEDISTELSCYNHPAVHTPNLDKLAAQGARFTNCFTTAPSCAPSRSALLTGVFQTRIGAHNQRFGDRYSKRDKKPLARPYRLITEMLREQGYFTAVGCGYSAKTDLQFTTETKPFDADDFKYRDADQPFFAQITLGVTHRGEHWKDIASRVQNAVRAEDVQLPPYYPDHPLCRQDWADYLNTIQFMDGQVGEILDRLEREKLTDSTAVFFMGDNGRCHLRGKCWLYDPGIRVPLIVRCPGKVTAGSVRHELVSAIDISAQILRLAGIEPPEYFDGRAFLEPDPPEREYVFAARDRIDEAVDCIRCVRTRRYKYIRNFLPQKPWTQKLSYVEAHRPMLEVLKQLHAAGKLTEDQARFLAPCKPAEELYDLENDPHELNNLACCAEHADTLSRLRKILDNHLKDTNDTGLAELHPSS